MVYKDNMTLMVSGKLKLKTPYHDNEQKGNVRDQEEKSRGNKEIFISKESLSLC